MIYNKIQLLRNKPIKIERDEPGTFIYVQGPTIGELYDSEMMFLSIQIMMMTQDQLREFIGYKNKLTEKHQLINIILTQSDKKGLLLECFKKILGDVYLEEDYLTYEGKEISTSEWDKIKKILTIIMGEESYNDFSEEEKELSPQEKKLQELERKLQEKKKKQQEQKDDDKHVLEDIIIALTYEFGFDIEYIMSMNYFTLIWYYSYTSRIHVYRINQFSAASGMVKKINTDYFTNIK